VCWIAAREGIMQEAFGIKGMSGILQSMAPCAAFLHDPTHTIVFSSTPKHAFWMKQVDIWLSILVCTVLTRGHVRTLEDLKLDKRKFRQFSRAEDCQKESRSF
jgi:hypothetical protein